MRARVCVCVRERERERAKPRRSHLHDDDERQREFVSKYSTDSSTNFYSKTKYENVQFSLNFSFSTPKYNI